MPKYDPQIANRVAARSKKPKAAKKPDLGPQLLPDYLQQAPVDAFDPYAHGDKLDFEGREPSTGSGPPLGMGDLAYYGILAGMLGFGGGKTPALRGAQTNPTVGLRAPTDPLTFNARNTFSPVQFRGRPQDPRYPSDYQGVRLKDSSLMTRDAWRNWLDHLPPQVSRDPNFLRTYAAHPLEMGAKSMYSMPASYGGSGQMGTNISPQGTLYGYAGSPWGMNEQLRALPAAQQAFARQQVRLHGAESPGGPSFFDRPPMMQVDRTAQLAERSKMLNAVSRGGSGAPFPYISPPRYQKNLPQMLGLGAGPVAGVGLGVLLDQIAEGGLSTLIPGRKLGGKTEYDIMDVAEDAGGGIGDLASWLYSQTIGKGYGE